MLWVGGKMNQVAIQVEGGHLVADLLLGFGSDPPDKGSELFQPGLDVARKRFDIFIDGSILLVHRSPLSQCDLPDPEPTFLPVHRPPRRGRRRWSNAGFPVSPLRICLPR